MGPTAEAVPLELMPAPAEIELATGSFAIDATFSVGLEGEGVGPRLERGVWRMLRRLSDRSTLFFDNRTFLDLDSGEKATLRIGVGRIGEVRLGEDESYHLEVNPSGIVLEAATDIGALRGLETLLQLLRLDENGVTLPLVVVDDAPRFPWRGLMIDASHHI